MQYIHPYDAIIFPPYTSRTIAGVDSDRKVDPDDPRTDDSYDDAADGNELYLDRTWLELLRCMRNEDWRHYTNIVLELCWRYYVLVTGTGLL